MRTHHRRAALAALATLVASSAVLAGCGTGARVPPRPGRQASYMNHTGHTSHSGQATAVVTSTPAPTADAETPAPPSTPDPSAASPAPPAPSGATAGRRQLPRGGTTILDRYRVVAYYGGPDGPALGALGAGSPAHMAAVIANRAKQWAGGGLRLQPAMELIATVAQGGPGPDGLYSKAIPAADVQRYLDVAHRFKMLLILDFQPGRGEFLPQVERFAKFLRDPSVSVALDPEWKVGPHQVPGRVIGSARAASINRVQRYLSRLVARNRLPDKLLMVHEFTPRMLPDRGHIDRLPGLEVVFHADGFGSRAEKIASYDRLDLPGRPFGAGFKLFLTQDAGRPMTPRQVLALRPRPDVITYQ